MAVLVMAVLVIARWRGLGGRGRVEAQHNPGVHLPPLHRQQARARTHPLLQLGLECGQSRRIQPVGTTD